MSQGNTDDKLKLILCPGVKLLAPRQNDVTLQFMAYSITISVAITLLLFTIVSDIKSTQTYILSKFILNCNCRTAYKLFKNNSVIIVAINMDKTCSGMFFIQI